MFHNLCQALWGPLTSVPSAIPLEFLLRRRDHENETMEVERVRDCRLSVGRLFPGANSFGFSSESTFPGTLLEAGLLGAYRACSATAVLRVRGQVFARDATLSILSKAGSQGVCSRGIGRKSMSLVDSLRFLGSWKGSNSWKVGSQADDCGRAA